VPPREEDFADAILAVIRDVAVRDHYRRSGRERSLAFNWAASARQHEEVYLEAASA
jgi:glycosyltransferase involved in cell wall biosynthesis